MLIFQIKRIISREKWFNYVVTFFFENAKNLGRSDDAKRRKKRGWPYWGKENCLLYRGLHYIEVREVPLYIAYPNGTV